VGNWMMPRIHAISTFSRAHTVSIAALSYPPSQGILRPVRSLSSEGENSYVCV
jgi:hypothetical protein